MIEEFNKWFEDLRIEDVPSVGGKNASLGEMIRTLGEKGVNVPSGFAVTAYAYKYTIENAGVDPSGYRLDQYAPAARPQGAIRGIQELRHRA